MAWRFRRSIRLAPGLRLNLSGSGASFSVGPRGASLTVGPRGTHAHVGIPGTGLYNRMKLGGGVARGSAPGQGEGNSQWMDVRLSLDEDSGVLRFLDAQGEALEPRALAAVKRQAKAEIQEHLQACADEINVALEQVQTIHRGTPPPDCAPQYQPKSFNQPAPSRPQPRRPGFWEGLFAKGRARVEAENQTLMALHAEHVAEWRRRQESFDAAEAQAARDFDQRLRLDTLLMDERLEACLKAVPWPRETQVELEIEDEGRAVWMAVDLPEVEDMPSRRAQPARREHRLLFTPLGRTEVLERYARHVHGVVFRLVGESFAALPSVQSVVVNAYTQRADAATGQEQNCWILAVEVRREPWEAIAFKALDRVDPQQALARFTHLCTVESGILQAIQPLPRFTA